MLLPKDRLYGPWHTAVLISFLSSTSRISLGTSVLCFLNVNHLHIQEVFLLSKRKIFNPLSQTGVLYILQDVFGQRNSHSYSPSSDEQSPLHQAGG